MVEWRVLGVVQDSDSEDGASDLDAGDAAIQYPAPAQLQSPAAGRGEQAEPLDLFASSAPAPGDGEPEQTLAGGIDIGRSRSSSILSSVPSSLPSTPRFDRPRPNVEPQLSQGALLDAIERGGEDAGAIAALRALLASDARGQRTFRQRNPIQLHPYLLENEQYRQALRARGVRPVLVEQQGQHRLADDSQYQPVRHDGHARRSPSAASLPSPGGPRQRSSSRPSRSRSTTAPTSPVSAGERREAHPAKRRKYGHGSHATAVPKPGSATRRKRTANIVRFPKFRLPGEPITYQSASRTAVAAPASPAHNVDDNDQFASIWDIPMEDEQDDQIDQYHFEEGQGSYEEAPEEPAQDVQLLDNARISSIEPSVDNAQAPEEALRIEITVSSDSESDAPRPPSALRRRQHRRLSQSSASQADESHAAQAALKRATKGIKGVLPASWLRLDQRQPAKRPVQRHDREASLPATPQPGVAKRLVKARALDAVLDPGALFDDDSEEESATPRYAPRPAAPQYAPRNASPHDTWRGPDHPSGLGDSFGVEVQEEDWVDPMLPSASRHRKAPMDKTRQTSLAAAFDRVEARKKPTPKTRPDGEGSVAARPRQRRPRQPVQLSILDAVEHGAAQPDFIKLACRRVRKRPDKGRHSPSAKHISFWNDRDTHKSQQRIRQWRHGRLQVSKVGKNSASKVGKNPKQQTRQRVPLADRHDNHQTRFPSPEKLRQVQRLQDVNEEASLADETHSHTNQRNRQTVLQHTPNERGLNMKRSAPTRQNRRPSTRQVLRKALNARPGQLEGYQSVFDQDFPEQAFARGLRRLNQPFEESHARQNHPPLLDRFLNVSSDVVEQIHPALLETTGNVEGPKKNTRKPAFEKRRPKRAFKDRNVQRLDFEDHFPTEAAVTSPTPSIVSLPLRPTALQGLGRFGTQFTTDFGLHRLQIGVYFNRDTFLGSGDFAAACKKREQVDGESRTTISFTWRQQLYKWSYWTDQVASQIQEIMNTSYGEIKDDDVEHPLRKLALYLANVQFYDLVDKNSLVATMSRLITEALDRASVHQHGQIAPASYLAVIAFQVMHLSSLFPISGADGLLARTNLISSLQLLAVTVIDTDSDSRMLLLNEIGRGKYAEHGIKDDESQNAEALIILRHLCRVADLPEAGFLQLASDRLLECKPSTISDIESLEGVWTTIFSILPFSDFDNQGILVRSEQSVAVADDWAAVTSLMRRLFEMYTSFTARPPPNLNAYLRTCLTRCFVLAKRWRWHRSEQVLGCIFDFFAKRLFTLLDNEGFRLSPVFLEHLNTNSAFDIDPSDRSFDIFLKLLAFGLVQWKSSYTDKKMKNLIWRYIPNHGRRHARDTELAEEDLHAIRNQHNLLCVLYWASPPRMRIDVQHLRARVDLKQSHFEICRVNIRSWANLVRFQLAKSEGPDAINPLAAWFNDFIQDFLTLHRQARSEALSGTSTKTTLEAQTIESIIANNERQVEGLLTTTLTSLRSVLAEAGCNESSLAFFGLAKLQVIFGLLDVEKPRFTEHILLCLDVYRIYFAWLMPTRHAPSQDNEDSQEFGEWSGLEDLLESPNDAATLTRARAFQDVHQLLVNCLGADKPLGDTLVTQTLDTWFERCRTLVALAKHEWADCIGQHGPGSWFSLPETAAARAYTPYALSKFLLAAPQELEGSLPVFLTSWLVSLVQRELNLKFQHVLTNALLKSAPDHVLLQNLPIWRTEGEYSISLDELRERRLGIISAVLANMQQSAAASGSRTRQQYAAMLKAVMSDMKRTFEETQGSSLRGSYVEFVQKVVEFIQQHAADISPVDKFFTDSVAFPLPAADPTYVIGRLKSYRDHLENESMQKKLVVFVQSVCERAAVDNQQDYLVDQLALSVHDLFEEDAGISLRTFLLGTVFPRYVEWHASPCAWLLAAPILQASAKMLERTFFCFDMKDEQVCKALLRMITSLLASLSNAVDHVAQHVGLLIEARYALLLQRVYQTATAALPLVEYLVEDDTASEALSHLQVLQTFAARLEQSIDGQEDVFSLMELGMAPEQRPCSSIAQFCKTELKRSLDTSWSVHNGEYFVVRGNSRREVVVDVGPPQEELERLLGMIREFDAAWTALPSLSA